MQSTTKSSSFGNQVLYYKFGHELITTFLKYTLEHIQSYFHIAQELYLRDFKLQEYNMQPINMLQ